MQISFQLISSELKDSSDGKHSTLKKIIEIHLEIVFTGIKIYLFPFIVLFSKKICPE